MPDLKMSTVTKFAVAVETDSSGRVDWFDRPAGAVRAYCDAIGDRQLLDNEVNLFTFSVAAGAQRHEIDNAADQAMWHRSYTPIRWRAGSAHSALAHNSAPTDPTVRLEIPDDSQDNAHGHDPAPRDRPVPAVAFAG